VQDRDGLPLVLFRDDWALQHAEQKHPELKFLNEAPQLHLPAEAPTGT
jgi:peptide chain release factor 3